MTTVFVLLHLAALWLLACLIHDVRAIRRRMTETKGDTSDPFGSPVDLLFDRNHGDEVLARRQKRAVLCFCLLVLVLFLGRFTYLRLADTPPAEDEALHWKLPKATLSS